MQRRSGVIISAQAYGQHFGREGHFRREGLRSIGTRDVLGMPDLIYRKPDFRCRIRPGIRGHIFYLLGVVPSWWSEWWNMA